jgi:hypothetical protein
MPELGMSGKKKLRIKNPKKLGYPKNFGFFSKWQKFSVMLKMAIENSTSFSNVSYTCYKSLVTAY